MIFEIFRTSGDLNEKRKPCKNAFKVEEKINFYLFDTIIRTQEYHWEIDIKDFEELMKLSGETENGIILKRVKFSEKYNDKSNEKLTNTIEIYDSYKE